MTHKTLPIRSEVPLEDTWRLEDFFQTDEKAMDCLEKAYTNIKDFDVYKGQLTTSGDLLYKALSDLSHINQHVGMVYVYTHLKLDQDSSNSFYQGLASKSEKLLIDAGTATAFVNPELSLLTTEKLEALITEEPNLSLYKRLIEEILRQKNHILDTQTEALLSQFAELGNTPKKVYSMFNNADMKFPIITDSQGNKVQLTHGNFIHFLQDSDRQVRKDAFNALYSTYESFKNTSSAIYAGNVQQASLFASIRHFPSSLEKALDANNIPLAVYNNLIDTVNTHLPLMHEYLNVRKESLSVEELHMYDLYVPLVKELDKKISFNEACEIVLKALAPLGEDYLAILKEAFDNRWIDKYENKGKRSGAYSWGTYGAPHPYVLMNYMDNLDNLFTLAHEMGHAVHSYLSNRKQPHPYASYCIFVAEVASTVNESLLMQYLLKTTTEPMYRKYLINYFMEQFRGTVFRQTMFAEFEKTVFAFHQEGKSLTTDLLCDTYYDLVKKYHGNAMHVDQPIAFEWSRIPHFFNTPFYVYQYATGFSAAVALSNRILDLGEEAVIAYKQFLSSGSSKDPIDLLKDAGVDMSTSKPIEDALEVFKNLIEEFKTFQ